MALDRHVDVDGQALRLGFTTGTCAALAARAATRMLLTGRPETEVSLVTPGGIRVTAEVVDHVIEAGWASCAVRKDAGDDPDVTDGILVYARVEKRPGRGSAIDGGPGVGRVTRPGLDQAVGEAAINSGPRRMIEREVGAACRDCGYDGGMAVVISVPEGEERARRTFNANLGIVGGISILGTSGIVRPMSTDAVKDSMRVEMRMLRAEGRTGLVVTPGNYGEEFIAACPWLSGLPHVTCSNFIGAAVDAAAGLGFSWLLAVGHAGKFIKLAGGIMDTHSRIADCRLELLALHGALAGADAALLRSVMDAATVDEGFTLLGGRREAVAALLLRRADGYLRRRAGDGLTAGVVLFSNRFGLLGVSPVARRLVEAMET